MIKLEYHEASSYHSGRIPLFKEKLDLSFYAQQRVEEERGIFISFIFKYLSEFCKWIHWYKCIRKNFCIKGDFACFRNHNNEPINHIETKDILGDAKEVKLNTYFYSRNMNEICRLETIITSHKSKSEGVRYQYSLSETIWIKKV